MATIADVMHFSLVAEKLVKLQPLLALTCKSFYKKRLLRCVGQASAMLSDSLNEVTLTGDKYRAVEITDLSGNAVALSDATVIAKVARWRLPIAAVAAFQGEWPSKLQAVEVTVYLKVCMPVQ